MKEKFEDLMQHLVSIDLSKVIEIVKVFENGKSIDNNKIFDNVEFKNALTINIGLRNEMLRQYIDLKEKVEIAIHQISNELEK